LNEAKFFSIIRGINTQFLKKKTEKLMKKFFLVILFVFAITFIANAQFCDSSVDSIITAGTYTGHYVLDASKVYKLTGKIYIGNAVAGNGASLTIPAGTLLFGDKASKAALVITRGAKGYFLGTAQKPIVFTSCFAPGQRNAGDWGGLMILGNAINNRGTELIEGGFDPVLGNHGGPDAADNSGTYQYVRVEFSGVPFTTDDETNGITFGSVGSGTIMDHCQVSFSGDDGFEWFGGSNSAKYLISFKSLDDDFDTDHGWVGNVQFGFSYRDKYIADVSNSEAFESDNVNGPFYAVPRTACTFSNMTAIGPRRTASDTQFDPEFYHGVHQRRGTLQNIYNSAFSGWDEGMVRLDGNAVIRALQQGGAAADTFKFSHITFAGTPRGSATGTKVDNSAFTLTDWNSWYDQVAYDNDDLAQPLDLGLVDMFNELNPNLVRTETSPLKSTGTNPNAINSFFTANTFRGAFAPAGSADGGQGRWDAGWTNYNPQATPYAITYSVSNVITLRNSIGVRSAVFGRAPGATDGIDASLGELAAPPLPPADEIDIRWQLPGTSDQSILDLRSDLNTITNPIVYTLLLQRGSGSANNVLSWDPDAMVGGSYTLKDGLGGVVFANVNMRTQSSLNIPASGLASVVIELNYGFSGAVSVDAGWNMVAAMGINPSGMSTATWWPGLAPSTSVFKYNTPCDGSAGYQTTTTMEVGRGVWMKNATTQTYNTGGEWPSSLYYVADKTLDVCSGWNLISGLEYVALTSELLTAPSNQLTGALFGYDGGYQVAITIDPGKAYWAKFNANCELILPGPYTGAPKVADFVQDGWGKIIVTDNAGNSYTLYSATGNVDLSYYELPPVPPSGIFDVRFGTQRFIDDLTAGQNSIEFSGVEFPVKIKVEGMSLKVQDISGQEINSELNSGDEVVIYNNAITKLIVLSADMSPVSYSLEQNYPNPFNPSTTIKFSLPEVSNVKLTIYNAIGQRVAELVNEQLQAGNYSYQWNASNLASGLYLYELRTQDFVATKKMLLMK
jgi:hypothetical protein